MYTDDPQATYVTEIDGRNYAVHEGEGRVEFLDSRFYRCKDGSFAPSVTTILEAYPKGAQYYEWLKRNGQDADNIRDEAGRRGSVVHEATEVLDAGGELDLMQDGRAHYKIQEWAMIQRYVEFRERFPATVHACEMKLASPALGYAGTLDRVLTIGGTTYLMDIKTSGGIWPSYWLQQAAYHELLHVTGAAAAMFPEGVPEIRLAILWLNAKTKTAGRNGAIQGEGWQLIQQPEPTEVLRERFRMVHGLWLAENAGAMPRTTSLKLKLKI